MAYNGPAIWGGCVTRRKHRVGSWYFSQLVVTVQALPAGRQGGYGTRFCRHGTNFIACWRDRGTSFIGATNLSPVTNLATGTGAVSRYNMSRSQKFITEQKLNCVQMRVSRCNNQYKFVLGVGAKAKTVTNNLPILSVLAVGLILFFDQFIFAGLLSMRIIYLINDKNCKAIIFKFLQIPLQILGVLFNPMLTIKRMKN
jgi:hypothetical protein